MSEWSTLLQRVSFPHPKRNSSEKLIWRISYLELNEFCGEKKWDGAAKPSATPVSEIEKSEYLYERIYKGVKSYRRAKPHGYDLVYWIYCVLFRSTTLDIAEVRHKYLNVAELLGRAAEANIYSARKTEIY